MALERTITVEESAGATYITLKDITTLEEWVAGNVDPDADFDSASLDIYYETGSEYYTETQTISKAEWDSIRDGNGLDIFCADLDKGTTYFEDGVYTTTLNVVFNSISYPAQSSDIFISTIKNIVVTQTLNANWKYVYQYNKDFVSSDLQKRYMLMSIENAADVGLADEAERLRLALVKICS